MSTRRNVLTAMWGAVASAAGARSASAQITPKTYVLVHGAWGGGWVWRRVADRLEKRGHKVFTPTLTGLGERSHLLNAQVNLRTHIMDVANVIKWERLDRVVLVGHSYGGMVISGVAEEQERAIGSIVFVDGFLPENNQAVADFDLPPTVLAAVERREIAVAPPPAEFFDVNKNDRAWMDMMATPHPVATLTDRIRQTGARERIARKAYVLATIGEAPAFRMAYTKLRSTPGWKTFELPTGHFVMVDMADRLVEILLAA